jgi:hypothetical protein
MVWRLANWTDEPGNVLRIGFPDMFRVPLRVWILTPPFETTKSKAQMEVARATSIFNSQHCGIRFSATYEDATNDPDAIEMEKENLTCGRLKSRIGFVDGAINVVLSENWNGSAGGRVDA